MRFREIEHKFVVDSDFSKSHFVDRVRALSPLREQEVQVSDRYFLLKGMDDYILRHRYDEELQQLSMKSRGKDNVNRLEVNLSLSQEHGDQSDAVAQFLEPLGVKWSGTIQKCVHVFYFRDCEIVYYEAQVQAKSIRCIEFESKNAGTEEGALHTISNYEKRLGFEEKDRCRASLFELFFDER